MKLQVLVKAIGRTCRGYTLIMRAGSQDCLGAQIRDIWSLRNLFRLALEEEQFLAQSKQQYLPSCCGISDKELIALELDE